MSQSDFEANTCTKLMPRAAKSFMMSKTTLRTKPFKVKLTLKSLI